MTGILKLKIALLDKTLGTIKKMKIELLIRVLIHMQKNSITQAELAARLKTSDASISRLFSLRTELTPTRLARIETALNTKFKFKKLISLDRLANLAEVLDTTLVISIEDEPTLDDLLS